MPNLGAMELTLILVIVVLLFGAKRLPDTAKSLGQSLKIFKKSVRDDDGPTPPPVEQRQVTGVAEPVPPKTADDPNRLER